jgi:hypothetical protein
MRMKVVPHHVEHLDDARIANGVEDLIALAPAQDNVLGPENGKMLGSIRLLQVQPAHECPRTQLSASETLHNGNTGGMGQSLKEGCLESPDVVMHMGIFENSNIPIQFRAWSLVAQEAIRRIW